jgi:hypothetical protein
MLVLHVLCRRGRGAWDAASKAVCARPRVSRVMRRCGVHHPRCPRTVAHPAAVCGRARAAGGRRGGGGGGAGGVAAMIDLGYDHGYDGHAKLY